MGRNSSTQDEVHFVSSQAWKVICQHTICVLAGRERFGKHVLRLISVHAGIEGFGQRELRFILCPRCHGFGHHILRYTLFPRWHGSDLATYVVIHSVSSFLGLHQHKFRYILCPHMHWRGLVKTR